MVKLFGWEIRRKSEEEEIESFAPKIEEDGATTVVSAGGSYGTYVDLEGSARTEAELVSKYREISLQPEIEEAIDDIVNESMDTDDETIVSINLDKLKYSDKVKKRIREEFDIILDLLQFNMIAFNIFRRWYIDGRMYYHVIIDLNKPEEGIKELRYIDPRKIRKVREIARERKGEIVVQKTKSEYYVYSDRAFGSNTPATANSTDYGSVGGLKIAKDAILHVSSGLMDKNNVFVLSYLHKAIRPLNMLRALEDATVIYRLSRAPERRVFYIDVGSLPKAKAEQYLRDMMVKHKNRLVYDASTGEIRDDRKYMTMLEDYWLPRREGNRGTEITTLPSGQNLGVMDDVEYFQKKLYKALNVPVSRLQSESGFTLGRTTEISRDEVKFSKFVGRLRKQFSHVFYKALEKQLILKRVIAEDEWAQIQSEINFDFAIDNYFSELKYADILVSRAETMARIDPYVGRYYSEMWVRKNILMQDEDDIIEIDKEIEEEKKAGKHAHLDPDNEDGAPPPPPAPPPPQPAPTPPVKEPEGGQQLDQSLFPPNKPIKRK